LTQTTPPPTSPSAIDAIAGRLDTIEWNYARTEKKVDLRFPSKLFTGHCVARVHDDRDLLILATLGLFVPVPGRLAVRILMNRLKGWAARCFVPVGLLV
jgi:hypothetical protein